MSLAVVDASVLVVFYASDDTRRPGVVARLSGTETLCAPTHLDVEVASALRGMARTSAAIESAAPAAMRHLAGLPLRRMPIGPLLTRMWELRDNLTSYDAAYVALAERLGASLVTCDQRLAGSWGPRCPIECLA